MARKRRHKKHKGHAPLTILKKRLKKLTMIVKRRGG